jgi:hypothetical protein
MVILALVLLSGCGTSSTTAQTSPRPESGPSTPSGQTSPTGPADSAEFWALARRAFVDAGRVKVVQAGAVGPMKFHYEPTASARIDLVRSKPVVVCLDGRAYFLAQGVVTPGQGTWSCGGDAFVDCFRAFGGPGDGAYSTALEANTNIAERVGVAADGTWTWDYSANIPYDRPVTATVRLVPATGRIVRAIRQDPQGTTNWTVEYGATFAPIVQPST